MTVYVVGIAAICVLIAGTFLVAEGISPLEALRLLASRWTAGKRR